MAYTVARCPRHPAVGAIFSVLERSHVGDYIEYQYLVQFPYEVLVLHDDTWDTWEHDSYYQV